ncbi:DUF418 domain-containing protein [Jejuia spongiicola]|uniref:DUF418 domain-containing protein n=1 Tax=Jejuia spongiicola TaxID=2942207 RepID=A0ABT0QCI8_9FLAO|nr:DUF418 domain-containing protein [Jejuia spongiicola]MCL6294333.1 DUF418 domain-containing protein [Jejuia spongiicola]
MVSTKDNNRIHVVDALRGLAIVSIMLLHNLEHFDVYFLPENFPDWLVKLDKMVWDSSFFMFAGKSYAMFALLFGLTFFIQTDNQAKKGKDFRPVFAWRLVLLLVFGIINSAFYQGDILTIYAVIGFLLIPFARLNNKVVLGVAIILLLQPIEIVRLLQAIENPDAVIGNPESWAYFGKMDEYIKDGSFINTVKGNLTNGKIAVLKWSNENGRFLHILSLFLFGMLAGRKKLFKPSVESNKFWTKALVVSSIAFVVLYVFQKNVDNIFVSEVIRRPLKTIETSWTNLSFMVVLVSGFVLLFQKKAWNKVLRALSPIGKMSLSNYILQSIIGSTLYYGFGFGLYKYTGATYSFLISIVLSVLIGYFSYWWMKNNKRGPLETIWHKATWVFSKKQTNKNTNAYI